MEEWIMKKVFYLVAIATLAFVSCQKEIDINEQTPAENHGLTFKASIEALSDPATKAAINASNQLVWAENDQIGIYVNDATWTDKNQPFTLVGTGGTTSGEFAWDYGTFDNPNATAAFFPWEGTGSDKNNIYDGNAYFKLRDAYWSYTSGKMLTPLVASLSGNTGDISFKHAGAAVKVTINNIPAHAHSIGMSVEGQQVSGEYSINPANAGTDALALVGTADATKNSVWLNYWNGSESKWEFIFPVPEVTKPKLSFQIWDDNGILVWSKKLKAQSSDLGRGDILVMPAIDITPYAQFTESADWTFVGTIGGIDAWEADIPMYTDGTVCILSGITFAAGDKFKIRKDKKWDEAYPASDYYVNDAGKYDVVFNISSKEITLQEAKCPYPAAKVTLYFGIDGAIPKSIHISSSTLAPGSGWPGLELTEKEYINGKWYYKHVVDGPAVWGNSISSVYIVSKDTWNTSGSTLTFSDIKTEYYFEASSGAAISQLSGRPADASASGITIDGDMSDWAAIPPYASTQSSRIREWKFKADASNVYFYFSLRKNRSYTGKHLVIGFNTDNDDATGWAYDDDKIIGLEAQASVDPFTNASGSEPVCVNGLAAGSEVKAASTENGLVNVWGYDAGESLSSDNSSTYIELSIPRDKLNLPATGATITIGCAFDYYVTGTQSITLE